MQWTSPFLSRLLIQLGKKVGIPIRRILRVPTHEEAKTYSDFLTAATLLIEFGQSWAHSYIDILRLRLHEKAICTKHGYGWGLEFPYVSRYVNVPTRTPNIYQTGNAIYALLDTYELNNDQTSLQSALLGYQFLLNDLGYFERDRILWFRYWPRIETQIINVQALTSSVLARLGRLTSDETLCELADRAVVTVLMAQNRDGSWFYSMDGKGKFVDGFHTGFILQGLMEYKKYRGTEIKVRKRH